MANLEDKDLDFVDVLMKKAFNFKAPKMPVFSEDDKLDTAESSNVLSFFDAEKVGKREDIQAINDDDLDLLCAAGSRSNIDDDDSNKDE
ncbi:MAG: hypothetical protein ACI4V7_07190 [Succinivibrionaceae bacterium]